mgnify:CR=1 FL=1
MPRLLYDALPYLVAVIGAMAALIVYNRYAIISGIALIALALVIVHLRLRSRTRRVEHLEDTLERERKVGKR